MFDTDTIYLSIYLPIYLSIRGSVRSSVCLSVRPPVCLSFCALLTPFFRVIVCHLVIVQLNEEVEAQKRGAGDIREFWKCEMSGTEYLGTGEKPGWCWGKRQLMRWEK